MVINSNESGILFFISFLRMYLGDAKAEVYLERLAQQKVAMRAESARTVLALVLAYLLVRIGFLLFAPAQ